MIGNIDIFENFLSTEECDFILNKYKNELILSEAQVTNGDYKSSAATALGCGSTGQPCYQFAGTGKHHEKKHELIALGPC